MSKFVYLHTILTTRYKQHNWFHTAVQSSAGRHTEQGDDHIYWNKKT